jgi:methionyl-tRNA formyltransferase
MRIVVHGQQAFGKAVLERLLERNDNVVGVFCAPDRAGRPADPLKELALERGLPVHQPTSWKTDEALELMRSFEPELCVMAYVTLLVPQPVLDAPKRGTIQYHPSLLPRHRGPSSINWPIIQGETETGITIFWPDEALDEGPILLQKRVAIGPDDTLGSLYFNQLFPLGVDAMMEAIDLVRAGKAPRIEQDHAQATYESWCKKADARIDWSKPAAEVYNLIRGTDPQPGAWTLVDGTEVQIYDSAPGLGLGTAGTVLSVADDSFEVAAQGGSVRIMRVRPQAGKKMDAGEFARAAGVSAGKQLGVRDPA